MEQAVLVERGFKAVGHDEGGGIGFDDGRAEDVLPAFSDSIFHSAASTHFCGGRTAGAEAAAGAASPIGSSGSTGFCVTTMPRRMAPVTEKPSSGERAELA
jgi:hypothetical protein